MLILVTSTFVEITVILLCFTAVSQAKAFYSDKLIFLNNEQLNVDADSSIDRDRFYRWAVKIPTIGVAIFGIYAFFQWSWNVGMYIAFICGGHGLFSRSIYFIVKFKV